MSSQGERVSLHRPLLRRKRGPTWSLQTLVPEKRSPDAISQRSTSHGTTTPDTQTTKAISCDHFSDVTTRRSQEQTKKTLQPTKQMIQVTIENIDNHHAG
ncbi:hypothetical protein NPIL_217431 [Nephila pilipes]|uniref:Uncharacterized protein n=1 Tax=Nephila pilipes TaxID=299642 RepID=A0A8X6QPC6_NEPPI|nr:hypothetical protein NPIL_217431 [Nephila pilipes]